MALIGIIGIYLMARPSKGSDQEKAYADIQLSAWTNPDGMATPSEVFSLPENEFEQLDSGAVPNYGFFRGAVWLRFQLEVGADNEDQLIELRNPLLNEVDLYVLEGKDLQLICATGDSRPYASRMLPHSSFVFPVEKLGTGNRQCFLRITGGGEQLLAPLHLWTPERLANRDSADRLMRGCYFGLILFVLLLNLFLYLVIRERSSLYYVNYNCFLLLLQLSLSGYAIQYLWPSNPYLANVANPLFASLSIYWLLRFSRQFLSLHSYFPRINRVFRYTGYVVLLNAIISLIPEPNCFSASVLAINVLALCLNLAIIPVALMVLRQNFKPALFFLLAFVALVITVFGFIATNAGLIRNDFYADYGLLIGSGAEVILLSFAIVDKFKRFRDQAVTNLKRVNQMTRQQNEILEHKVALRTQKINEQKNEIEAQKEEILASIRYAQRIQKNLLPTDDQLKNLFPESFVLFQPRDIVSGDFYWTGSSVGTNADGSEYTIKLFATGDGTGHGVPGAMMSVMGINLLNTA
ncbi:MAG: hypothetical protein JNM00_08305, partial [Flavobacteriales bacterium]|nr:hypothetical protein [Flavobacteriales bacterium]